MDNLIYPGNVEPVVGMGATEYMWSDNHPYTVIDISESGKTLKLQADTATRTDTNGMSESQSYDYTRNPDGEIVTVRLTKKGWKHKGRRFGLGHRREYHDYSF